MFTIRSLPLLLVFLALAGAGHAQLPDPAPALRLPGLGVNDLAGSSVTLAGDFNGDGIADLALGAPNADSSDGQRINVGKVYVLYGRPEGLAALPPLDQIAADSGFLLEGRFANQFLGDSLAAADLDGDGIDDLVAGAPRSADFDNAFSGPNYGLVAVVFGDRERAGAAFDLGALVIDADTSSGLGFVLEGALPGTRAGASLASPGDVNGDGIDDLLVGSEGTGGFGSGGIRPTGYLVFGRAGRDRWPGVFRLTALRASFGNADLGALIQGRVAADNTARAVAGLGDVNGDGLADFAVGAPQASFEADLQGSVYLIAGQESYPEGIDLLRPDPPWLLSQIFGRPGEESGSTLLSPGDLDGDGRADLAIGSVAAGETDGRVDLLYAPETWPEEIQLGEADFGASFRGAGAERLGADLARAGDQDGDGRGDLVIGARDHPDGGRAYLVPSGSRRTGEVGIDAAPGVVVFAPEAAADSLGRSVTGAGDLDADGSTDLALGAPLNDAGAENAGAVFVYGGNGEDGAPPMEGALSHAWYDRTRPGQGVLLEYGTLAGNPALFGAWYTFEEGRPLWLVTDLVAIDPVTRSVETELFLAGGARFGDAFDPGAVSITPWGRVRITQTRCAGLLFEYTRAADGRAGRLVLTPVLPDLLAQPLCTRAGAAPEADARRAATVGTWWNPERAGEGIIVDLEPRGGAPTLFFSWFTFREGQPLWLVGSGRFDAATGATEPLAIVSAAGAAFGPDFAPGDVELIPWGEALLRFEGCGLARLEFDGADGAGSIELVRFTGGLEGLPCIPGR